MKILILNGLSGTGKTTIAKKLTCKEEGFHLVRSYTTRRKRYDDEDDHTFVSKEELSCLMWSEEYVASSVIDGEVYCGFYNQFSDWLVNVYIVDDYGYLDVHNQFAYECGFDVFSVRVKDGDGGCLVDDERRGRFGLTLPDAYFDMVVCNDDSDKTVNEIIRVLKGEGWLK